MTKRRLSPRRNHPKSSMVRFCFFNVVLILATGTCVFGQNTASQPTPQTRSATPAASGSDAVNPPVATPRANSAQPPQGRRSGNRASQRRTRSVPAGAPQSAEKTLPPAAVGNSSIGVIGDSNGDGLLDRDAKADQSTALPGIAMPGNALGIATGTPIMVRLNQSIDSGHAHNGDTVRGALTAALGKAPSGAPVTLTVVAAAAAGQIGSNGTLSLQVISVNGEQVLSQVLTAEGKEGPKTLADDAAARGTEAVFTADQPITLPAA